VAVGGPRDFGFWILDFGLQERSVTIQNPKSKIAWTTDYDTIIRNGP